MLVVWALQPVGYCDTYLTNADKHAANDLFHDTEGKIISHMDYSLVDSLVRSLPWTSLPLENNLLQRDRRTQTNTLLNQATCLFLANKNIPVELALGTLFDGTYTG